jgi:N utilization substance protein B
MSNRHLARTMAMQCLFQWDFNGQDGSNIDEIVAHVKDEFAPDFDDGGYLKKQIDGVIEHLKDIDEALEHFAPEWPISEMTNADRNILRLAVYELRYDEAIPAKVAINEAIELGKTFSGKPAGKFINGVMGAVYRDMLARGEIKEVDKNSEEEKDTEIEAPEVSSEKEEKDS